MLPWTPLAVDRPNGNMWSMKKWPSTSTTKNHLCSGHTGMVQYAASTSRVPACIFGGAEATYECVHEHTNEDYEWSKNESQTQQPKGVDMTESVLESNMRNVKGKRICIKSIMNTSADCN
jgi:hypothetical protein